MSMSTHIVGFKPVDEKWHAMKKIWVACVEVSIEIPEEVLQYFQFKEPDESGVMVEIEDHSCVYGYQDDSQAGFEVNVKDLPKDVTAIRFYNAW